MVQKGTKGFVAAIVVWLMAAGSAAAQDPIPTPPPAQPPPAAPPPNAALSIALDRVHRDGKRRVALKGDRFLVTGRLSPSAPGERVVVRVYRGSRRLLARRVKVREDGTFRRRLRARWRGSLRVAASHRRSQSVGTAVASPKRLVVVIPRATATSRGPLVRMLQQQLDRMRYAVSRSGAYDGATQRAVMAWRKVNGRRRLYTADRRAVRAILAGRGAYKVRHPGAGKHVEADISRQVLALVNPRGRLHRVYHTSSGAPATPTIIGSFRVYSKTPGTNSLGMVHSAYFIRGYAIHGYASVPPWNASHGCLRVPLPDAWTIYTWLATGDRVIVDR